MDPICVDVTNIVLLYSTAKIMFRLIPWLARFKFMARKPIFTTQFLIYMKKIKFSTNTYLDFDD